MIPVSDRKSPASVGVESTLAPAPRSGASVLGFEFAAQEVLARLQDALAALLRLSGTDIRKAADVERAFGIDHRLGWQVYRIVHAPNPLAAGSHVPAKVSVTKLLKAAAKRGIASEVTATVAEAFKDVEHLVREHAGTRAEFDALIASAVPDARERSALASRESLYHASRMIRGASMRVALYSHMVYPNAERSELLDECNLMGNLGLQRIRRASVIETSAAFRDPQGARIRTISGLPITEATDVTLPQFCSAPTPRVAARPGKSWTRFVLEGEDVGVKAAVDCVCCDYLPAGRSRFATESRGLIGAAYIPDVPAQRQVVDLLVHDEVVLPQTPDVRIYEVVPHGMLAAVPDPDRELDRVAIELEARPLGRGLNGLRCPHVPTYPDMVAYICRERGWDPNRLTGFRLEIEYPAYSWQSVLTLRLPSA